MNENYASLCIFIFVWDVIVMVLSICLIKLFLLLQLPLLRWKRFALVAAMCILAVRAVIVQIAFYLHIQVSCSQVSFPLDRFLSFSPPILKYIILHLFTYIQGGFGFVIWDAERDFLYFMRLCTSVPVYIHE